jgi:hypothetical protein
VLVFQVTVSFEGTLNKLTPPETSACAKVKEKGIIKIQTLQEQQLAEIVLIDNTRKEEQYFSL